MKTMLHLHFKKMLDAKVRTQRGQEQDRLEGETTILQSELSNAHNSLRCVLFLCFHLTEKGVSVCRD